VSATTLSIRKQRTLQHHQQDYEELVTAQKTELYTSGPAGPYDEEDNDKDLQSEPAKPETKSVLTTLTSIWKFSGTSSVKAMDSSKLMRSLSQKNSRSATPKELPTITVDTILPSKSKQKSPSGKAKTSPLISQIATPLKVVGSSAKSTVTSPLKALRRMVSPISPKTSADGSAEGVSM
jgi:hypothetical protein